MELRSNMSRMGTTKARVKRDQERRRAQGRLDVQWLVNEMRAIEEATPGLNEEKMRLALQERTGAVIILED
jgi:hypothetical protein